jgi:hypothetical protein
MLACLLAAGLYPFDFFPENRVSRLPSGFSFEGRGMVSSAPFPSPAGGFSLEMALTPAAEPSHNLARILSIIDASGRELLTLSQWMSTLEVAGAGGKRKGGAAGALRKGRPVLLSLTVSGGKGVLALDGKAGEPFSWGAPGGDFGGAPQVSILLGNSPRGKDSWRGTVEKVAMTVDGSPGGGSVGLAWVAPRLFRPIEPSVLEVPERSYVGLNRSFLFDALINFFGFVPWGVCLTGLAAGSRVLRRVGRSVTPILVVAGGFLVSLVIELLQVYLPGRTSSLTDLALNTAGAAAGLLLFRLASPPLRQDML